MQRARAGAIGALVLVVLNLIFDLFAFPTFAAYGFRDLKMLNPLYYFVTTTMISFAVGLSFAILYLMIRSHLPYKGISKGIIFGLLIWSITECIKAAQIIAYTTIPLIFTIIWLFQGLISYIIYGIVLWYTLEPHAHLWVHPDLIGSRKIKRGKKITRASKSRKVSSRKKKSKRRKTKRKSSKRKTKKKSKRRKRR